MQAARRVAWLLLLVIFVATGCQNSPFLTPQQQARLGQNQQSPHFAQLQDVNRRNSALDSNNNELHAQLAQERQHAQDLDEETSLLRKQLGDTVQQLKDMQTAKLDTDKRLTALQASTRYKGGATITANNSLKDGLRLIDMPGLEVRADGDVIRIELPADKLFQPGTANLLPAGTPLLDQVADSISRNYRQQRIGIEGHTDSSPVSGTYRSGHQLTAAQASAIFERLTTSNRLPAPQLFTMAHGANLPRFSNGDAAGRARNRRIELVIYPETLGP